MNPFLWGLLAGHKAAKSVAGPGAQFVHDLLKRQVSKPKIDPNNPSTWPKDLQQRYTKIFMDQLSPNEAAATQPAPGKMFNPPTMNGDGSIGIGPVQDTPIDYYSDPNTGVPMMKRTLNR